MSDIDIEINVSGAKESIQRLYNFSNKLGDRVTTLALRSGARYMLVKARSNISAMSKNPTGRLARAAAIKSSKINTRRKNGIVGVYLTVKSGKKRNDMSGAYYAKFVEHGYIPGKQGKKQSERDERKVTHAHTKVKGKHYLESAYNSTKKTCANIIVKDIELAGSKLAKQIGL